MPREFIKLTDIGATSCNWQFLRRPKVGEGELPLLTDPDLHYRLDRYPLPFHFTAGVFTRYKTQATRIASAFDWLSANHTGAWLWKEIPGGRKGGPSRVEVFIEREQDRVAFDHSFSAFFERKTLQRARYDYGYGHAKIGRKFDNGNLVNQAIVVGQVDPYRGQESLRVWCEEKSGFQLEVMGRTIGRARLFARGLTPIHTARLHKLVATSEQRRAFAFDEALNGYWGPYDVILARQIKSAADLTNYPTKSIKRLDFSGKLGGIVVLRSPELIQAFHEAWPSLSIREPSPKWRFIDPKYQDILGKEGVRLSHPDSRRLPGYYKQFIEELHPA